MTYAEYYDSKRDREQGLNKEQRRAKHEIERQFNQRLAQVLSEDKELSSLISKMANQNLAIRVLLDGMVDAELIEIK